MQDDEQRWSHLMVASQQGDRQAYATLLTELSSAVAAYLRKRFGSMPFLEDCVQESLMGIHNAHSTYDGSRPFKPWLFAIVKYKSIDFIRKYKRHDHGENLENCEQANFSDDANLSTEPFSRVDDYIFGAQILMQMPREHSEVLVMTKYMGYSVNETAAMLSISNAAVRQRVRRAIVKAQTKLLGEPV